MPRHRPSISDPDLDGRRPGSGRDLDADAALRARFRARVGDQIGNALAKLAASGYSETPYGWDLLFFPRSSSKLEDLEEVRVVSSRTTKGRRKEHETIRIRTSFVEDYVEEIK